MAAPVKWKLGAEPDLNGVGVRVGRTTHKRNKGWGPWTRRPSCRENIRK